MGPSGPGKSTLMNLIGCLDTADAGSYRLNGHEVSALPERDLARVRNREIRTLLPRHFASPAKA